MTFLKRLKTEIYIWMIGIQREVQDRVIVCAITLSHPDEGQEAETLEKNSKMVSD